MVDLLVSWLLVGKVFFSLCYCEVCVSRLIFCVILVI